MQTSQFSRLLGIMVLLFSINFACNKKVTETKQFSVRLNIKNLPSEGQIKLIHRLPGSFIVLDTMVLPANEVVLRGNTENTDIFEISLPQNKTIFFVADSNSNLVITGDFNEIWDYKITPDSESERISLLIKKYNEYMANSDRKNVNTDSLKRDFGSFLYGFIKNRPGSAANVIAFSMKAYDGTPVLPIEKYYGLYKYVQRKLAKKYALSDFYLIFYQFIKNYEVTKNRSIKVSMKKTPNRLVDFRFTTPDGNEMRFTDFVQNRPALLIFTASWCNTCKEAFDLYGKIKKENYNLSVLYIALDTDSKILQDTLEKYQIEKNVYVDSLVWNSPVVEKYNVQSLPTYVLFGKNGKILSYTRDYHKIEDVIKKLFKKR